MNPLLIWIQFIASAALVIVGGFYLARHGKEFGERHGLSDLWVGFIFLAAVTSIPELATALGAVLIARSPALALNNVLGSNAFNLFIIVVSSIILRRRPITSILTLRPFRLLLILTLLMTGLVMAFAALDSRRVLSSPANISLGSWAVIVLYLIGSWKIFRDEHPAQGPGVQTPQRPPNVPGSPALYPRLLFSIILVVAGGFWLARTGREIAEITGWGESFIGALFLALVTSLPEVVVCLAAIRMRAYNMALGNILGSNVFNLGIIFLADLAYREGSVLSGLGPPLYVAGWMGIVLTLLTALSLAIKAGPEKRFITWDDLSIGLIYLAGMYWLFRLSAT